MSDPGKKILRVLLGLVLGFMGGSALGICLFVLVVIVCMADGGDPDGGPPRHAWVKFMADNATGFSMLVAVAGCVVGTVWALRRNWRDETKKP